MVKSITEKSKGIFIVEVDDEAYKLEGQDRYEMLTNAIEKFKINNRRELDIEAMKREGEFMPPADPNEYGDWIGNGEPPAGSKNLHDIQFITPESLKAGNKLFNSLFPKER